MESLIILWIFTALGGEEVPLKISYYREMFGHVHRRPVRYSEALSTISCGHPLQIYPSKQESGQWIFVKTGPYEGYVMKRHVVDKRPRCFQDKYPKFINSLGLSPSDRYYWGRLYDKYIH